MREPQAICIHTENKKLKGDFFHVVSLHLISPTRDCGTYYCSLFAKNRVF
jgi:hypothetical protein